MIKKNFLGISIKTIRLFLFIVLINKVNAQNIDSTKSNWTIHFQTTSITQGHTKFNSPYQGLNSFNPNDKSIHSTVTSTLYIGHKLWKNAEFYFNPEMSAGSGMSNVLGIAGAPNGDAVRVGNSNPTVYIARMFFKQYITIGDSYKLINDDVNQLSEKIPENSICIIAGRFSVTDFHDNNDYSHDPRSQFMNWSLMSNGAWDYPANAHGYTNGIVFEYLRPYFEVHFSSCMMPTVANGQKLDWNVAEANGETLEFIKIFKTQQISVIVYDNYAYMGNYELATHDSIYHLNISETRKYGNSKPGFGINYEKNINNNIGIFSRIGWNNGKNETFAFTEIDKTASIGCSFKIRKDDVFACAFVVNGISQAHRDYLSAGGYGFIIGDGKLNYENEIIFETYYSINICSFISISPDYQYVINPAYNKDRGPIDIFGLRLHLKF